MSSNGAVKPAKPRVRVAPTSATNEAEDAIFLASSYGLTPDEWQAEALTDWLGRQPDGRWSAATCGLACPRQNGKNAVIEVREMFGMIALGEKILHTAHEVKTARKAFRRIAGFFDWTVGAPAELAALVVEIRKTNGQEAVVLRNGGSVEFIARSRGSGRGYTADVLVLDEAQDLKDDELEALLPTISAPPLRNPQVILTGTPPDPEKGQTGEVFARIRREHETDPRLTWTDFGPADGPLPDLAIHDPATWARCNPALGIRLDLAEIEREHGMMSAEGFARERLGWWGDPAEKVANIFGAGRWEACAGQPIELPEKPAAIGVAVSADRTWASIASSSMVEVEDPDDPAGGRVDRVFVAATDRREEVGWLIPEVARIQAATGCMVIIDEKGPTKDLLKDLEDAGVKVEAVTLDEYAVACSRFFDKVRARALLHPSSSELDDAVSGAAWRRVGDRRVWGRRASTTDVSMLEAASLAAHGAEVIGALSAYEERGLNVW